MHIYTKKLDAGEGTGNTTQSHTMELPRHVARPSEFIHSGGPSEFTVSLSEKICTTFQFCMDI
jgi:hypothetical protein